MHDCENGKKALEYLNQHQVDVLLTDIKMPVMDGINLSKEINLQKKPIQIVFLSGYKDFYYAKEALRYGVVDYIVKPGKYEEIHEVFSNLKKNLDTNVSTAPPETVTYTENIIYTIKEFTKKNYANISLDDLAELCKMSPNYISTFFKEKTGTNFSAYLTEIRMRKAAEMLGDFHYKTYEISNLVGYTNPKNFTRMFKKYYGVTPREYRNKKAETVTNE
ncbi:Helix-turn-helix domain-containing protein [Gracilibacillus ureilyticus]|uniref:Helix-turn-helix domain-containing protein n=1 Tax=Gracilibacillus ureilyticus TaxID=531814 RepID=A0A1H9UKB7_9BACI|nr:Helix-turn-helix domain-containing protein [Gracilibacillus ureilyticus]